MNIIMVSIQIFFQDLKTERDLNVELGSKYTLSQNQYEGMKSYANQLQVSAS